MSHMPMFTGYTLTMCTQANCEYTSSQHFGLILYGYFSTLWLEFVQLFCRIFLFGPYWDDSAFELWFGVAGCTNIKGAIFRLTMCSQKWKRRLTMRTHLADDAYSTSEELQCCLTLPAKKNKTFFLVF